MSNLQSIHRSPFNDQPFLIAFHEGCKTSDIFGVRYDGCALLLRKDLAGEMGLQWFICSLVNHIRGKQPNSPCATFACRLHDRYRDIHRRRHDALTHFPGFEEATMTENLVNVHVLLIKEDIHSDLQGAKRRKEMRAHEVDRKSTRLNSSHQLISYAVFC